MGELRDDLASSLSEQQSSEQSQVSQPETSETTSGNEGNTQSTDKTQAIQEYEIGGKKFKSWDETKKWADNYVSQRGRETNELHSLRTRNQELEKGEAAQWLNDLKQHPKLAEKLRLVYKEYNDELAGGATKKEAATASGMNQLPPELKELLQWKQEVVKEIEAEQTSEKIDKELEELKAAVPKIDEETLNAVYDFAAEHLTLSLKQAYNVIMAEINAKKVESIKDTGNSGKFATVKTSPKKPNLSKEEDARRNIAQLLKE